MFWPLPGAPLRFPRTFVFLVPGGVGDFSRPLLASFGLFWPSSLFGVYAGIILKNSLLLPFLTTIIVNIITTIIVMNS